MRVVVFASGSGSNFRALVQHPQHPSPAFQVVGLVCDNRNAGALTFAEEQRISYSIVGKGAESRLDWETRLAAAASAFRPDWVVLAGFMFLLRGPMLERFPARILNVHPSLLPEFPGLDAPTQALRAGAHTSGCTVHLVDAGMDTGPILAQARVALELNDTTSSLHARIQQAEHRLLPYVIDRIAREGLWTTPAVFSCIGDLSHHAHEQNDLDRDDTSPV